MSHTLKAETFASRNFRVVRVFCEKKKQNTFCINAKVFLRKNQEIFKNTKVFSRENQGIFQNANFNEIKMGKFNVKTIQLILSGSLMTTSIVQLFISMENKKTKKNQVGKITFLVNRESFFSHENMIFVPIRESLPNLLKRERFSKKF